VVSRRDLLKGSLVLGGAVIGGVASGSASAKRGMPILKSNKKIQERTAYYKLAGKPLYKL